jgi:hypothetical protein
MSCPVISFDFDVIIMANTPHGVVLSEVQGQLYLLPLCTEEWIIFKQNV